MFKKVLRWVSDTLSMNPVSVDTAGSQARSKRKAGFTLVELMVVIIIVNLLSGVAVPKCTDLIEKTREKIDLLKLYYLRDALNRALYEDDVHNINTTNGAGKNCGNNSSEGLDKALASNNGVGLFVVERHSTMPANYQGKLSGSNTNNMCGLMFTGGFWNTALKDAGFEAVADIVADRANNNNFNEKSSTYTLVKKDKKSGIEWDRTYPTKPIFISRFLNKDPNMQGGTSQNKIVLKIRWSGGNPDSHSLEVFFAPDNGTYLSSSRSRMGTCFSTLGDAGCKNTR